MSEQIKQVVEQASKASQWSLVALVSAAVSAVLLLGGFTFASLVSAVVLVLGAVALSRVLRDRFRRLAQQLEQQAQDAAREQARNEAYVASLESLCAEAMPLMVRQIESSRAETESSIHALSSRFAQLSVRLTQAVQTTTVEVDPDDDAVSIDVHYRNSQAALQMVADSLNETAQREKHAFSQVKSLSENVSQLSSMSSEVTDIAEQINLLALNAAIEAARAGEYGRGFAVVADEVRKLAARSSKTGDRIRTSVDDVMLSMQDTLKQAKTAHSVVDATALGNEHLIRETLDRMFDQMRQATADADALRLTGNQIREEIDEVLVSLQFQDRVSQILGHVIDNTGELIQQVDAGQRHRLQGGDGQPINVAALLERMRGSYSTSEERHNHAAAPADAASADAGELTFF